MGDEADAKEQGSQLKKITAIIEVMDDEAVVVNLRKNDRFTIYSEGRINRS